MAQVATVNQCTVASCVFNSNDQCHALAITIDEPSPANCETYKPRSGSETGGIETQVANIGACKATSCVHNKDLMCHAEKVKISMKDDQVSCMTYSEG